MEFTTKDYNLIEKEFSELRLIALKRCASQEEYDEVIKAFELSNEAHKGMRRRSGVPYIIHPIAVAKIVVQEIGLGYKSIVAALLHNIIEDTDYTVDDLRRLFGEKIASLVDGLSKVKSAFDSEGENIQSESFKRTILTLNDDVRVILIRLADRLHNIRTLDSLPDFKKEKILNESIHVFIPLAHRLGLYGIKSEMENVWLKNVEPQAYNDIQRRLDQMVNEKDEAMEQFIKPISDALINNGYIFHILKRTKTPYSIWKKMNKKGVPFDDIYDLYAVRIIFEPKKGFEEKTQCWHIYALITGIYNSKRDRIRDWVNQPKSNGYEALHCTVMSNAGNWVEVQIRSERMNTIAENGVAAHWIYKKQNPSGVSIVSASENGIDNWLDKIRNVLENPDVSALQFLDRLHDSVLDSEIYVFTPKGESKVLPKGSTVLDFAYNIHSEIGSKALAGKVNNKLVPLYHLLSNGDKVSIITAQSQKPKKEWLDFLKTGKARSMVYEALIEESDDAIVNGREMLESELSKYNVRLQNRVLRKLFDEFKISNKDELYAKISVGLIKLDNLENILKKNKSSKNVSYWTLKDSDESSNLSFVTAECCLPVPGDDVIGYSDENGNIIIHNKNCPIAIRLNEEDSNRIVNVKWSKYKALSSLRRVKIVGADRTGILNELISFITAVPTINIRKILIETHDGIFDGHIDLYLHNAADLERLITDINEIKGIESVTHIDINDNN